MITVTDELLDTLTRAQLQHAAALATGDHHFHSDDGHDYTTSALDLASLMLTLHYDNDTDGLARMLNTTMEEDPDVSIMRFACDGIAPAFYELNPPAIANF